MPKDIFISNDKDKVQIWPSNKIRYAYLASNYYKKIGTIGNSCMRSRNNQKALNFYVKNNVKIAVIVTKDNRIKARALLWENVNKIGIKKKTYTYLDRVYYSEEKHRDIYLSFAKDNKFLYYPKDRHLLYIKKINLTNVTHLPYTDTFNTLYYEDKVLGQDDYNFGHALKLEGPTLTLKNLNNGGYVPGLDKNATQEVFTAVWLSKKDCVYIKKYEGNVAKENIIDIDGDYYSIYDNKNIYKLSDKNGYCLIKNVVTEYVTKDKIDKTKAISVKKYGAFVLKSNVIYVNKILYSKHDKVVTQIKNKYYLTSNTYKSTILDKRILKGAAIIAYKLEIIKQRNTFVIKSNQTSNLFGLRCENERKSMFINTQQNEEVPEFIGPYYIDNSCPCIILNTGEYIIKEGLDTKYLIRRNKKYYLRHLHKFKDKKQQLFAFKE